MTTSCKLRVSSENSSGALFPYLIDETARLTDFSHTPGTIVQEPGGVPVIGLCTVAWQSGNGALANVALDRALADDPQYSMAMLLRQVITSGAPPWLARLQMTPEEVAASYGKRKTKPGTTPAAAAGPVGRALRQAPDPD